jgi:site-specific DNA-cytosine methylase
MALLHASGDAFAIDVASRVVAQPQELAGTLGGPASGGQRQDLDSMTYVPEVTHFRKSRRAQSVNDDETWVEDDSTNTLNAFDVGDVRTTEVVIEQEVYPIRNATRGADDPMYTLDVGSQHAVSFVQRGRPEPQAEAEEELSPALRPALGGSSHVNVAYSFTERTRDHERNLEFIEEQAYALMNPGDGSRQQERNVAYQSTKRASQAQYRVRRLTPRECLLLQGFSPDHLDLEPPLSDTAKYRAIGNAVCCNVTEWLGKRLADVLQQHPA